MTTITAYQPHRTPERLLQLPHSGPLLNDYWRCAVAELREAAATLGHSPGVVLISRTSLVSVLHYAESIGGSWREAGAEPLWRVKRSDPRLAHGIAFDRWREAHADLAVGEGGLMIAPTGSLIELLTPVGAFVVATDEHTDFNPTILVHGESKEGLVALMDAYNRWLNSLESVFNVWGGGAALTIPRGVDEADLILPPELKSRLLGFVDQFAALCRAGSQLDLPVRRGMILAGKPGTGKTQFIRHLRKRLPDAQYHIFLPSEEHVPPGRTFAAMLQAIRSARQPVVVILEELDRLLVSKALTAEYLLNSLDGMLELASPALWVATTNDPDALENALINRPGRFDAVFAFHPPGAPERTEMLRRFSIGRLDSTADVSEFVRTSDGLYGSHLRAACSAAVLADHMGESPYFDRLRDELVRMRRQQGMCERPGMLLNSGRAIGFG